MFNNRSLVVHAFLGSRTVLVVGIAVLDAVVLRFAKDIDWRSRNGCTLFGMIIVVAAVTLMS